MAPLARTLLLLPLALSLGAADPALARDGAVEEIVVRARRRAERLVDTPVSVTAISAGALRDFGATRLDDVTTLTPNMQMEVPGDGQAVNFVIRGIGTSQGAAIAFDPGVGVYVDGVFMPRTVGSLLDVLEIEQVEVLRGPQGTLFGRNTVGGAVNVRTTRPSEEFSGSISVRPGSQDSVFTRASINLPISIGPLEDRVFARFGVSSFIDDGFVFSPTQDEYVSNRNTLTFVGALRFLLTERLTFDVAGSWSREHNNGLGAQCVFVQPTGLSALVPGFEEACRRSRPHRVNPDTAGLVDSQSYGVWGTLTWAAGAVGPFDDLEFKSISAWREQQPRFRLDVDQTELPVLLRAGVGGGERDGLPGFQRQVSQELQVSGTALDDRLQFVTGVYAQWEEGRDAQTLAIDALDIVSTNLRVIDNWNWALYGQATYDVTDWLSLTAGLRYTEEKKGLLASNRDPLEPPEAPPAFEQSESDIFTAWTPMGTVRLTAPEDLLDGTPVDHLMGYFTYARGFRGGGFNGVINPVATGLGSSFRPETLDSFELGFKTLLFDRMVNLNVAAFYSDYQDIQVTSQLDLGDVDGDGITNIEQTTLNAAVATTYGLEAELMAFPMDGTMVSGGIGLLHTEYDEFLGISNLTALPLDRSGERFNNAARFQLNLAVQHAFSVEPGFDPVLNGTITPRLDLYVQTRSDFLGPEVEVARNDAYAVLNGRLSYSFWDDRAQVALWIKNLTDERYIQSTVPSISSFGFTTLQFAPPLTFGAELSWRF